MKHLTSVLLSFVVAFGLLFAAGCDSTGSGGESGTLSLRMNGASSTTVSSVSAKSSSVTVSEALVTIDKVSIVPSEDTSKGNGANTGVTVLSDSNFTVDLVDLQTGLDTAMTNIEIPAGKYSQLRLITADMAEVTFQDGSTRDVRIASGQQTGLKLNFDPFEIESADDRVEITLNWNVEQSLQGTTQAGFTITPVIATTIDTSGVGN